MARQKICSLSKVSYLYRINLKVSRICASIVANQKEDRLQSTIACILVNIRKLGRLLHTILNNIVLAIVSKMVEIEKLQEKLGEALGLEIAAQKAVEEFSSKGLLDRNDMISKLKKCSRNSPITWVYHYGCLRYSSFNRRIFLDKVRYDLDSYIWISNCNHNTDMLSSKIL